MSLLNRAGIDTGKVNDIKNVIRNPLEQSVQRPFRGQDFPEGFIIEELDFSASNRILNKIVFAGNTMPQIPFKFGGKQRVKKDFYAGNSEPAVQILGPEENDTTIKGHFKDIRFKEDSFYGFSQEIQELVDAVRLRGNLCRFLLGDWQRYGYIEENEFELIKKSRLNYEIRLSIIGFNAPSNAKFLERPREVPFDINKELIERGQNFNELFSDNIPDSVPRSIGDQIRALTGEVADDINLVTGFVDQIFSTIEDVQKSIFRVLGLIKNVQNTLRKYKRTVGSFDPFDPNQAITGQYQSAKFFSSAIAGASFLTALLARFRAQFNELAINLPQARHLVRQGDTLQKISVKFYGTADNWKNIFDFNQLQSTDLTNGTLLDIPRLER